MINWSTGLPMLVASGSLLALVALVMARINDLETRVKALEHWGTQVIRKEKEQGK